MVYSKSKVDRAGRTLAEQMLIAMENSRPVGPIAELQEAIEIIDWWRGEHARPLSRVAANLRYYAAQEGEPVVAQRLKKFPTIADKLLREPQMKLSRMADIGGVRAVLSNEDSVYHVAMRLRRNWTITRVRDYIAEPKDDGYRALHLINRNHGRLIEVQLRTRFQHAWASNVEATARVDAPGLKFGGGPEPMREFFKVLGEVLARLDRDEKLDDGLLAHLGRARRALDSLDEDTGR